MIQVVEQNGVETAAKEVDVVTTGTFGAMCSSGAFFNFGHADPPTKLNKVFLNDVEAYHGNAAVDCYLGVTQMSRRRPFEYGGGHVIEDLLNGKTVHLEATFSSTDCYPGQLIDTEITIDDLNQAILCNPRNAYQRYTCAVNSNGSTTSRVNVSLGVDKFPWGFLGTFQMPPCCTIEPATSRLCNHCIS